jgi:hypothetical protein
LSIISPSDTRPLRPSSYRAGPSIFAGSRSGGRSTIPHLLQGLCSFCILNVHSTGRTPETHNLIFFLNSALLCYPSFQVRPKQNDGAKDSYVIAVIPRMVSSCPFPDDVMKDPLMIVAGVSVTFGKPAGARMSWECESVLDHFERASTFLALGNKTPHLKLKRWAYLSALNFSQSRC